MSGHWVTVDIDEVKPDAVRIARTDLAVGDSVFDVWGRMYRVDKVRQTPSGRTTIGTRDDGQTFYLSDDDTITVVRDAR